MRAVSSSVPQAAALFSLEHYRSTTPDIDSLQAFKGLHLEVGRVCPCATTIAYLLARLSFRRFIGSPDIHIWWRCMSHGANDFLPLSLNLRRVHSDEPTRTSLLCTDCASRVFHICPTLPFRSLVLPRVPRRPPSQAFLTRTCSVLVGICCGEVVYPHGREICSVVPSSRMSRTVLRLGVPLGGRGISRLFRWVPLCLC